jgi:hypothetical protein
MPAEYNSAALPIYVPTSWAGVVPETEQAYDIRASRISEGRRRAAFERANAVLCDGISKVEFFVMELTLDVGISGTTSQARYTRDFYAHNITLPSLKVKAQCLDQGDYGVLVEFVHQAQKKAVGNAANNRTQLEVKGGGVKTNRPIMRGEHKRTCAQGFVPRIERRYKQGEYAPIFSFSFTIAQSFAGIYEDISASVFENEQSSWVSILEGLTTPFQPSYRQQETATNSKPRSNPSPQPEAPPEPSLELVQPLPGGGTF